MSLLSPRVETGGVGGRRLVFFVFGRVRLAPSALSLLLLGHVCIAAALAAPLLAWTMPAGEPYLNLWSLMSSWLLGMPTVTWIIAAVLALPMCIALLAARIWSTPRPHDWEWSMNATARVALAATIVLPVGAMAFTGLALLGLAANPAMFPAGIAPMPTWCAWLYPVALLAWFTLPALWLATFQRGMRELRHSCAEAGPACASCGYSRVGLRDPLCPECGVQYTSPPIDTRGV